MNTPRRVLMALACCMASMVLLVPAAVSAAEPTFGQPTVEASLGQPLVFSSTVTGDDIVAVEVLVRLVGDDTTIVLPAQPAEPAGTWQVSSGIDVSTSALCECLAETHGAPNTHFEFQFRVRSSDGTETLGPVGQGLVADERFEWRTIEQDLVRVHWYNGDEALAQSAADVANGAIDRASELLNATLAQPVDLFVYDSQQALLEAVSPNRENIAGEAHQAIGTMFVYIPPDQGADAFAGEVVRHELTHLVFHAATDNPYHEPALWINEGIAVYLSVGNTPYYRSFVDAAVADRSLIPLDGLTGIFPSPTEQFFLAYGESVGAIDFFVRTYGEPKLWELTRSYARGLSDDDAFIQATGADMAAFNSAWFASLGLDVRQPLGPQPAPTGPLPADWQEGQPSIVPSVQPSSSAVASGATERPEATPRPSDGTTAGGSTTTLLVGVLLIVAALVIVLLGIYLAQRSNARRPPWG